MLPTKKTGRVRVGKRPRGAGGHGRFPILVNRSRMHGHEKQNHDCERHSVWAISGFFVRAGGVEQPIAQWPSRAAYGAAFRSRSFVAKAAA